MVQKTTTGFTVAPDSESVNAEVPWMRMCEVWLHAVDLDTGARMDDLPAPVVDLLLDDVTAALTAKDDCPAHELAPTDRGRTWPLGDLEAAETVVATAADLTGWLTGRITMPTSPRSRAGCDSAAAS